MKQDVTANPMQVGLFRSIRCSILLKSHQVTDRDVFWERVLGLQVAG